MSQKVHIKFTWNSYPFPPIKVTIHHTHMNILLVEDNPADTKLVKLLAQKSGFTGNVFYVEDGAQALDFIRKTARYKERPPPDLILLDLNLPNINGFEVLRILKANPNHRYIPVIILTSSQNPEDVFRSFDLGASGYIQKPSSFGEFMKSFKTLIAYWSEVSLLAPGRQEGYLKKS